MNEHEINEEVVRSLFSEIRLIEGQNLRTGKMTDEAIRKYIERRIGNAVDKEEND